MFQGLRTVVYPAPDLAASRQWFSAVLGTEPYFEQAYYVGYSVGGYELGLDPALPPALGPVTYWAVRDADQALAKLLAAGATVHTPVHPAGDSIRAATVFDPAGRVLGVVENPQFKVPGIASAVSAQTRSTATELARARTEAVAAQTTLRDQQDAHRRQIAELRKELDTAKAELEATRPAKSNPVSNPQQAAKVAPKAGGSARASAAKSTSRRATGTTRKPRTVKKPTT